MAEFSTAAILLQGLADCGIEHVFVNLGTDHVGLIEAWATGVSNGRPLPRPMVVAHENVAINMAGGYAAATGCGQAVLVHVDAGTANAVMGLHDLFRGRLPVLLMAGKAPYTLRGELPGSRDNFVHFVQDPFDMASLVRPFVKWEYVLQDGVMAREAARRAHTVMQSDPQGPVYMMLPRETLARVVEDAPRMPFDAARFGPVRAGGIAPAEAAEIADSTACRS